MAIPDIFKQKGAPIDDGWVSKRYERQLLEDQFGYADQQRPAPKEASWEDAPTAKSKVAAEDDLS